MPPQEKAEALRALASVRAILADPEPLDGLRRRQAVATLDYATEQVAAIEELKRARRTVKTP